MTNKDNCPAMQNRFRAP